MSNKEKAVIYLIDTLDQRRLNNLKIEILQPFVELESYISSNIEVCISMHNWYFVMPKQLK